MESRFVPEPCASIQPGEPNDARSGSSLPSHPPWRGCPRGSWTCPYASRRKQASWFRWLPDISLVPAVRQASCPGLGRHGMRLHIRTCWVPTRLSPGKGSGRGSGQERREESGVREGFSEEVTFQLNLKG